MSSQFLYMNDMIPNAWLHNFKPCMADLFLERGADALVAVCLGGNNLELYSMSRGRGIRTGSLAS